jgi:general secretion pathway protein F
VLGRRRVTPAAVVRLTRELATLLGSGLPLERALSILGDILEDGPDRTFLRELTEAVRGGKSFADALEAKKALLPPYYGGLVRAGEAGGKLEAVLSRLAEMQERALSLRESIRSAMYYPIFVLGMSIATLAVLVIVVLPEFKPMFENSNTSMPVAMTLLSAAGEALRDYGWLILLAGLAIAVASHRYLQQPMARLRRDRWLLRLPLLGALVLKIELARFSRTLGTLLANGVAVLGAVSMSAGAVGNRALAAAIGGLVDPLREGKGLAAPLRDSGMFPKLAVRLVQVGEESGELDRMLLHLADIYDAEIRRDLAAILSLIVPIVTICLGVLVAAIIGSMLTAILSSYELPF